MAISYSLIDNKITVTEFSSITPGCFNDLYTADKAGTVELLAASPALNMVLATQIKPSDDVALRIDFILASSGAGAGDTIDVTGTDKDDGAQIETLITEADGAFTTTKWFKTITNIDCNGFNAGTLTVRQNQWGVIFKTGSTQFSFGCKITMGASGLTTHFTDTGKQLLFLNGVATGNNQRLIEIYRYTTYVTFGERISGTEKSTQNGCQFVSTEPTHNNNLFAQMSGTGTSVLNLYSCSFLADTTRRHYVRSLFAGDIWNCLFLGKVGLYGIGADANIYNIIIETSVYGFLRPDYNATIDKVLLSSCNYVFYFGGNPDFSFINIVTVDTINCTATISSLAGNAYFKNCILDKWIFNWGGTSTGSIYRQYTFNLKIINKIGNAITNANVKADYQTGVCFAQENVDASGNLVADKTVTKGFYDQTNGNTLVYQEAGFDYEYVDLTVTATGYKTHTERFSINEKTTKDANIIKLDQIGSPPGAWEHNV